MFEREERPRRPALPMTLHALVAALLVERAVLAEGRPWLEGASGAVVAGSAAVALLCCAAFAALGRRWPALCEAVPAVVMATTASLAGVVLSSLALERGEAFCAAASSHAISSLTFRVETEPTSSDQGFRCRATALADGVRGVVWATVPERLVVGTSFSGVGRFEPNADDEWGTISRTQGVWGSVRMFRVRDVRAPGGLVGLVQGLRERVLASLRPDSCGQRALLAGCVCGHKDSLSAFGLDELFKTCGVAHLVAVSGGHLAVLCSLLASVVRRARMRPRARMALLLAGSGLFVLLCGAPVSAIRAWLMSVLSLSAAVCGRRSHGLSSVCAVGLVMTLVDPTLSGQLGFVLSVSSVAGLCIYSAYASYVLRAVFGSPRLPRFVPGSVRKRFAGTVITTREALSASLVAQLVTLPVVAGSFGEVSLVGPVASVLLGVPFNAFVGLGIVAAALFWAPALQAALLLLCDVLATAMIGLLSALGTLPNVTIRLEDHAQQTSALVLALLLVVLVVWPPVRRRWVLAAVGAVAAFLVAQTLRWRYFAPPRIVVMDVGQGDAILVQDGAASLLVDTGPDDSVASALARNHVSHLDAVLITHLHDDHYGGVGFVTNAASCEHVLVARGVADHVEGDLAGAVGELARQGMQEVAYGDVLRVGRFCLRVVWPCEPVEGDENADSVELLVTYADGGEDLVGLLTGDAEKDELAAILEHGDVGDIDFLKVGHHGSEVSLTGAQAAALDAEVSVASAGKDNSYGHPCAECVDALEGAGSTFLCTKDVGDVEVRPGADGPCVIARGQ